MTPRWTAGGRLALGLAGAAAGAGCGGPRREPVAELRNTVVVDAAPAFDAAGDAAARGAPAAAATWGGLIGSPMPGMPAACSGTGLGVDVNRDGKVDLRTVALPGPDALTCHEVDLDFDGRFDATEIRDAAGVVQVELRDLDFDGLPDDVIVLLPAGGGRVRLRDLDQDGRIDAADPVP